jgi:acyl-CoA reductase-like NAD-dependent aldehyde dehydrogenase
VSLELGGKSPSIVLADADLDVAVASAAAGIFFNSGQVCSAGSRLLVERPVYDEVVAGIVEAGGEQVVGPALDPQSTMGPLISTEQLQRVTGYVERGLTDGAELLCGGSPPSRGDGGYFFDPTVFGRAPSESAIVREEIFGPVLVAEPFDSIEQIAERANDTPFGLAAAVFSRDLGKAQRLARAIRAGTVWINCYGLTHPAIPFGGYKRSGYGRDGGVASLEQYLETKAIWTSLS